MKTVGFQFNLDEKVTVEKTGFTGVITMCAIHGDVSHPENIYFVQGTGGEAWYAERLLKEAE